LAGRGAYTTVSGFAGGGTAATPAGSQTQNSYNQVRAAFFVTTAGANGALFLRFAKAIKASRADLATTTII
jgi:hypothetical protein